jgi:hypothetical protein
MRPCCEKLQNRMLVTYPIVEWVGDTRVDPGFLSTLERCEVCGAHHYTLTVEAGHYGTAGNGLTPRSGVN